MEKLISQNHESIVLKSKAKFLTRKTLLAASIAGACTWSGFTSAAAPVAIDDARTIAVNSSLTINVLQNDFDPDTGDTFNVTEVSTPANGSAVINTDGSIFYTPNTGFIGVDTFTYTIEDVPSDGTTPATAVATVTVTVSETVYEGIGASGNTLDVARVLYSYCENLRNEEVLAGPLAELVARCDGLEALAESDSAAAGDALRNIAPEETLSQMRTSMDSSRSQTNAVSQRIAHIQAGGPAFSLNGMELWSPNKKYGGAAGDSDWSRLGIFATVEIEKTERDTSELESGYETDGSGYTFGMDYRIGSNGVIGGAFGVNDTSLEYANDGGEFDSELQTLIFFGAWTFGSLSLEAQLGNTSMTFESTRNIAFDDDPNDDLSAVQESAIGRTKGDQFVYNLRAQWEFNSGGLSLFPFMRLSGLENKIEAYEELDAQGWAMGFEEQKSSQLTAALGAQGTYAVNLGWGVLIPTVQLTALSEVNSDRDDVKGYFVFDTDSENRFTLSNDGGDSSYYQFGLGSSAVFKHGLSGFVQYQQILGYEHISAWNLQAGFRFEI